MQRDDIKKIIRLSLIIFLLISVIGIILYINKDKNNNTNDPNSKLVECKEIGQGFIYYDGNFYYKNKNLCLINESDAGEQIGINEKHLKKQDIENNKFLYDGQTICAYAVYADTPIYKCKNNDNILLVKNEDYIWNGYYIYLKDIPYSESSKRTNLKYYIDNPDKISSISLISYGKNEIPIDINLNEFKRDENNSYSFITSNLQQGAMAYYLFIDDGGIYSLFEGEGNLLSDYIIIKSNEDEKTIQYVCKKDGLKDIQLEMYSDFFGVSNIDKDIIDENSDLLFNNTNNNDEELSDDITEEEEIYETGKTQSDLKPLQ